MKKFWNWIKDSDETRTLRLEGPIDEESFWGDEITPQMFRDELNAGEGDVTVWINSPGGNVFAAAEIYTMLKDYKGSITVKIDAIAASAASVVAMAGDTVQMSPVAMLMIHDPSTVAMGNTKDMQSWHPSRSNGLFESRPRRSRNKSRQAHRLGQVGINPVGWQQNRKNPARASRWSSIPRTDTNWRIFWKRATPSAAVGVWRQDRTLLLPSRRVSSCSKASSRKH